MKNIEEKRELIEGHRDVVLEYTGGPWTDDAPDSTDDGGPEALAAWAFVTGFASALDLTAEGLFKLLGLS